MNTVYDTEDRNGASAPMSELDQGIQRALARGRTFAASLPTYAWMTLNRIAETDSVSVDALFERGEGQGLLHRWKTRRALDHLLSRGYLRQDDGRVVLTVCGIGAIRPYMSMDPTSSAFPALRERRRQELAAESSSARGHRSASVPGEQR